MPTYTQHERPLTVTTPLGADVLLATAFGGRETISQLFSYRLDLIAEQGAEIHFDQILGKPATVEIRLDNDRKRYFNGLVKQFSQGVRDETFVNFQAEMVPKVWLLTKKVRCRVFQHLSVPDILRQVFAGFDVSYQISQSCGVYYPRDYCVQYRESDFHFASRLMEEEGIHYYFRHSNGSHQMVITDLKNPNVEEPASIVYDEATGSVHDDPRITAWVKTQEMQSGEYTLWDHCFEVPGNHLEAKRKTAGAVVVGKVTHKLNAAGEEQLEIYDYPGGYAQRFDGVDPKGAPRPQDLQNIYQDRERTVRVRMEEEDAASLEIRGAGECAHFTAGHKFTLERHWDANGQYLLKSVEHNARQTGYRSGETPEFHYENRFTCLPVSLRYRPSRVTPKPVIAGVQTATVTGPQGEEIFCDQYGRVKVQFHWDREGKKDANSSCWLRVAQVWAGKGWGAFFWPRVGHEVVVTFEDGDPDQPIIVGSLYNAENMPWYTLPINKELAGFKSASMRGSAQHNFNGIVFNDEKGHEHLSLHSERNLSLNSEADKMIQAGRHKGERVGVANVLTVGKFIPVGGGSGGGFDEGKPMPSPRPIGVVGLNSVFTFGDSMQAACPLNHQLAIGNNLQMCINPLGLTSGAPDASFPQFMQAIAGSGLGGNMQFTIGTNAQFTLGQSFEISVGPPKIEIHAPYSKHGVVTTLCLILGALSIAFMIAYDILKGDDAFDQYTNATTDPQRAAATASEQSGDHERVILVLAFQLVCDAMLIAIMAAEAVADKVDWLADDTMKQLFRVDQKCLHELGVPSVGPDQDDSPWTDAGTVTIGCLGIGALLGIQLALVDSET